MPKPRPPEVRLAAILRSTDGAYELRVSIVECALAPLPLPSLALSVTHRGLLGDVAQRAWIEVVDLQGFAAALAKNSGKTGLSGFSPGEFELDLDLDTCTLTLLLGHRRPGDAGTETFNTRWRFDSTRDLADWASAWATAGALERLAEAGGIEEDDDAPG